MYKRAGSTSFNWNQILTPVYALAETAQLEFKIQSYQLPGSEESISMTD